MRHLSLPFVLFVLIGLALAPFAQPAEAQNAPVPVYEVNGRVVDQEQKGLPDATVELLAKSTSKLVATAKTDASGAYKLSGVDAGDYLVSATHACCVRGSVELAVGGTELKPTAKTIQLQPKQPVMGGDPVKLTGTVKDKVDGKVLAGVQVAIDSYFGGQGGGCGGDVCTMEAGAQSFLVETDAAGKFEIEVNRGSAYLRATMEGFDATSGHLEMADARSIEIPLQPSQDQQVRLHGVLKDEHGKSISGWINAGPVPQECRSGCPETTPVPPPGGDGQWHFESSQPQWNSVNTNPDGSWELLIRAGKLRVTGSSQDHLEASKDVDASSGQDTEVSLALPVIPPDSVTIKGQVVDRKTGKPVEGASVSAENQKWGSHASAMTDANGDYVLKTKPGYTILTARADVGYACLGARSASDDLAASPVAPCYSYERDTEYLPMFISLDPAQDAEARQDFRLVPRATATSEFRGYVLGGASGEPIAGATVTFYNEVTRDWGSATTDEHGSYLIKVHPGYYSIRVWAEHHYDAVANAEIGEKASERIDLKLTPGEKRYGYWAYGAYEVASDSKGGAQGAPSATRSDGPPVPIEGQNVYEGTGGGLGPYHPMAEGGNAPGVGLVAILVGLLLPLAFRRRD